MAWFKPTSITWKELLIQTARRIEKDDVLGRSAQLGFYFFLALFPLLICILGLLGMFSRAGRDIQHGLFGILTSVLPWSSSSRFRDLSSRVRRESWTARGF